ncbi:MAG: UPF0104 family protein [Acidobacteria bacterium]|nr:MAG: UPF0104 family protein [Acidobacteriota bacterium]
MRSLVRNVAIALLAIVLLALFLRHADLPSVWQEIRRAELGLLAAAVASIFVNMVIRSIRWQYLLEPIGATSFRNAFRTTMIGFAATFVLPARAGELLRPYLLARREGFSATAAFATIVLERVLDLLTVVLLLAVFMLFFDAGASSRGGAVYTAVRAGGLVGGITGVGLLVAMFALAGRPDAVSQAALKLERVLPARAAHVIARLAGLFAQGLGVARDPVRLVVSLAWSVPLWLSIAFGIWTTSRAFHIDLPFAGSFLIIALLVVGVSVPTPGGVGGFHEAYRLGATAFYGVPNDRAVGAAIVLHAISFVPITIVGLLYFMGEGFTLKSMSSLASTAAVEDKIG